MWCDLETTGLDPKQSEILEMALVLTTPNLKEVDRKSWVFKPVLDFSKISEDVIKMHTKNGLWNEVIQNGVQLSAFNIENWLFEVLNSDLARDPNGSYADLTQARDRANKTYLAGSSVSFDRGFLIEKNFWFPKHISHRIFDVSVFRTALKMWNPELLWNQNATHRAMDDILDHIEEAKYYRKVLGLGTEN